LVAIGEFLLLMMLTVLPRHTPVENSKSRLSLKHTDRDTPSWQELRLFP
jgi:hypothetical protein